MATNDSIMLPRYLSPAAVCEVIPGMTQRSLKEMRARRKAGIKGPEAGPAFSKPNAKTIVYAADDIAAYMDAIRVGDNPKRAVR